MARRFFGLLAAVALASGATIAFVGPASAQGQETALEITVHKQLNGTPPGNQTFGIQLVCSVEGNHVFVQTQTISYDIATHTFSPSGADVVFDVSTAVTSDSDQLSCTVTESDTAGATSHTIVCTGDSGAAVCSGDTVTIPTYGDGTADFTTTNNYAVFPAPPAPPAPPATLTPATPAPVVVAVGRFTG